MPSSLSLLSLLSFSNTTHRRTYFRISSANSSSIFPAVDPQINFYRYANKWFAEKSYFGEQKLFDDT